MQHAPTLDEVDRERTLAENVFIPLMLEARAGLWSIEERRLAHGDQIAGLDVTALPHATGLIRMTVCPTPVSSASAIAIRAASIHY